MARMRRFVAFWYDFLVGDHWELFVGPIVALGVAWLLLQAGVTSPLVGLVLFVAVVSIGAVTITAAVR
jgi:hypothetical protein